MSAREIASAASRIVIKVGSSTLSRDGHLRPRAFTRIARQVCALMETGREVVIVSSGAIAVGSRELGWSQPGASIPEKQAAAAVGQTGLMELYQRRFSRLGRSVAQVLLTREGLEQRERFLNARRTLVELLRLGVVPIVNENDTVSTEEIRFGDNDNLSATLVNLVGAQLLIVLTDVDGLHVEKPQSGRARAPLFDVVEKITPEVEAAAQASDGTFGRGGMITKLEASSAAARSGAATVLCNGRTRDVLLRVAKGEAIGTLFLPQERMASRKHWLAFTARTRGELVIDDGAARALLKRGRSLLPAGVVEVRGRFRIGDSVACLDTRGLEVARGLCAYSAEDVRRLCGLPTAKISQVLGYSNGDEVIHRDDLVLLSDP